MKSFFLFFVVSLLSINVFCQSKTGAPKPQFPSLAGFHYLMHSVPKQEFEEYLYYKGYKYASVDTIGANISIYFKNKADNILLIEYNLRHKKTIEINYQTSDYETYINLKASTKTQGYKFLDEFPEDNDGFSIYYEKPPIELVFYNWPKNSHAKHQIIMSVKNIKNYRQ